MIKCLRVDHRLLHGQVAFSWTSALGADCILIANDADTYFPDLDARKEWEIVKESEEQTYFDLEYVFLKYQRRNDD